MLPSETPREWNSNRPPSKQQPLYLRLYSHSHLTDLVRLLGYEGSPSLEARQEFRELIEKHGEGKMRAAVEEITVVDPAADPPVAKLTEQARKLAFQILGPPPENWDSYYRHPNGEPHAIHRRKMAELAAMKGQSSETARKRKKAQPKPQTAEKQPVEERPATPLMQQYREAKVRHPDMLLLFRVGDFYELFHEDAETACKILGLTLTTRDRTVAMAGFPHHSLETYLRKLLHAGHRVAICDQVEDDRRSTKPRREVTRIVSPGSVEKPEPARSKRR